ncbi:hypothetical protein H312_01181 [Anncaliia algerae PRA339]|uniref:Uncharacterized protein n=1 Tax=Anncaliia algerae PRA339 TaxID=1288291 RepID=A0A059F380_9MICR|nr:hypothetical protein H312_01181 [Anncaliia algerae PRA339]
MIHTVKINLNLSDARIDKVIKKLINLILPTDFFKDKLGDPGALFK